MIEKLKTLEDDEIDTSVGAVNTRFQDTELVRKINELVDVINAIQKEREAERFEIQEWIGILEAVRKSVNIHEKQIDELQMKVGHMEDGVVCKVFDNTNSKTQRDLEIAIDALSKIALVDDAGAQMVATAREALTKIGNITPR